MKKIYIGMSWCLVLATFFLTGYKVIDPDLGWHLRMGEIISKQGIPKTDPFSYSMPSYPFVDYEWLTNVVWYKTFDILDLPGWSIIYSTLAAISMWVAIPKINKKYGWVVMLLGWSSMLFRFGVRAQVLNWFFWALIVRGLWDDVWRQKYKWFFPLLMLLWANLHGSFPLGILSVGIFLGLKILQERKIYINDLIIFSLGFIATFINPYGWKNWAEVVLVMQQSQLLRSSIQEWAPFYNIVDFGLLMAMVFLISDIYLFRKKWLWWQYAISLWMLWWAITGLRYAPLFMIFVAPIVVGFLTDLKELSHKNKEGEKRFGIFFKLLLILAGFIFTLTAIVNVRRGVLFTEEKMYPKQAVGYLIKNGYQKNLFSEYGWGGYLIWKIPNDRFFIDGRMSCFSWKAPIGESDHALLEYQKILNSKKDLTEAISKYQIKTLLWPKANFYENTGLESILDSWIKNLFGIKEESLEAKQKKFFGWWEELGWKKIYEDDLSVIYTKF